MKKLLVRLILLLVVVGAILFFARNLIARRSVDYAFTKVTGFPLYITSVNVAPTMSHVDVHDLQLMNPPEFKEVSFVTMPEFKVDYDLVSMITGAHHVHDMLINISQVMIVKTEKGDTNVQKLKSVAAGSGGSSSAASTSKTKYQVDKIRIHIGTVVMKDFSHGTPTERTTPVNKDITYENIDESTDIPKLVLASMLGMVHLPGIGVDMGELTKDLGGVTGQATQGVSTLEKAGKGFLDSLTKKK